MFVLRHLSTRFHFFSDIYLYAINAVFGKFSTAIDSPDFVTITNRCYSFTSSVFPLPQWILAIDCHLRGDRLQSASFLSFYHDYIRNLLIHYSYPQGMNRLHHTDIGQVSFLCMATSLK